MMAPQKKSQRRRIEDALDGLGIHGEYSQLIHEALVNDWSTQQILQRLIRTREFRRKFPGLVQRGGIAPFLANGKTAVSANTLQAAISNYYAFQNQYNQIARNYPGIKVGGQRMEALIRGQVSPEEFGKRLNIIQTVRDNPGLVDSFNEQLKLRGQPRLDKQGFFKFLAGQSPRNYYDIYESAYLKTRLGLSADTAKELGRSLGQPGQLAGNLEDIANKAIEMWGALSPEMERAGIGKSDVALLSAGQDPRGIASRVEQILQNRGELKQTAGTYGKRGSGGGFAMYEEDEAQSF